jgi:hypothetical protein
MAACLAVLATGMLSPGPARALDRTQLAVIINTWDPLSVRIGEYYAAQRRILFQNVIRVGFPPGKTTLTSKEFGALKAWVDEQTLAGVQAFALTWVAPYRVECMSITSAFAFGFDPAFCAEGCKPTRPSPYFNSPTRLPFTQLGIRPTMAIAATSFERAKELIDRGVESDGMFPAGTAYLLSTSDSARNVRSASYPGGGETFRASDARAPVGTGRPDGQDRRSVLLHRQGERRGTGNFAFHARGHRRPPDFCRRRAHGGQWADERVALAGSGRERELWHGCRAVRLSAEVPSSGDHHRPLPAR